MEAQEQLKQWISESSRIVFFGGAGMSTESGIPDFRGVDGLYHQQYQYPPETIISHSFYRQNPQEFYRFYKNRMLFPEAEPNRAHLALAKLEAEGKLKAVITQNIDGLHQAAGSKEVLELHGSVHRNYCTRCGKFYSLEDILNMDEPDGIPRCSCGGTSLTVYPAAGLIDYYRGNRMVLINKTVTPMDSRADLVISGQLGEVLGEAAGV